MYVNFDGIERKGAVARALGRLNSREKRGGLASRR